MYPAGPGNGPLGARRMRGEANATAADGNDSTREFIPMTGKDLCHHCDPWFGGKIRQPHDPRMVSAMEIHQSREIRVDRHQNTPFLRGHLQQGRIPRIRLMLPGDTHVVPLILQPCSKPPASAAINQELHPRATETSSSRSSASTACAYARQDRMSSGSSPG